MLYALHVQLNKAARLVTGLSRFTSTKRLMDTCGWLSAKQLVMYHTTAMVHKTVLARKPYYMHGRLNIEHAYRTRQHTTGCIRFDQSYNYKSDLPRNSFRCRGTTYYNAIPADIRAAMTMSTFKSRLKKWVRKNVSID